MSLFEVVVTAHRPVDRLFWSKKIAEKLVDLVGGVSVYEGKGGWRSPETGTIIFEEHTLLRAYVSDAQEMFALLEPTLRQYREVAEQEVVFVILDGEPYSLNKDVFDALESINTDPRFWRCACLKYYIHAKSMDITCPLCSTKAKNRPDASVSDIGKGGLFATDDSWEIAYNLSEYYDSLDEFDLRKYKK